jgi:alkylhydroperoxidase/carboxymuconolactone decarboxylase family protein YurZ
MPEKITSAASALRFASARSSGSDAGDIDSELDDPSETLGRWLRADLYGRCFGRPGLDPKSRVLISIAAVFPLELEHHLTSLVKAGRSCGFKAAQLWHLHDLLRRLFKDGPVLDLAEKAFAAALGGKKKDDFGPGKDPFRWD